jgi:hypothetical protein
VEVIEHEHDRALSRGGAQQFGRGVEQPDAPALPLDRGGPRQIGKALSQLRDDLSELRRAPPSCARSASSSVSRTWARSAWTHGQ